MLSRSLPFCRPRLAALFFALFLSAAGGSRHCAASEHAAKSEAAEAAEADDVSEPSADGSHAMKLGEFSIRVYHTISSRKDNVMFILYARIKKDDFESFEHLYSHRQNKVREQVLVATRLVPIEDYDDPELKQFRRRILLRIRRVLPELPIDELYFSDFSLSSEST